MYVLNKWLPESMSIFSEVASPPDPVTTGSAEDEAGAERITRGESRSSSELSELPSLSSASPLNRFLTATSLKGLQFVWN